MSLNRPLARAIREKNGDTVIDRIDSLAEKEENPYNDAKEKNVHSHTMHTGPPRDWRML
jgi:hypothetical protein